MRIEFRTLVLIGFGLAINSAFAQKAKPNREAYLQAMYIDSTHYYGQELGATPFIGKDNIVQLFTGEQVFLNAEIQKNELKSLVSIEVDSLYKPALSIDLSQQSTGVLHRSVTLTLTNNLKKDITLMVSVFEIGKTDWTDDKEFVIKKGKTATWVWKEPISSVLLSEWKLK